MPSIIFVMAAWFSARNAASPDVDVASVCKPAVMAGVLHSVGSAKAMTIFSIVRTLRGLGIRTIFLLLWQTGISLDFAQRERPGAIGLPRYRLSMNYRAGRRIVQGWWRESSFVSKLKGWPPRLRWPAIGLRVRRDDRRSCPCRNWSERWRVRSISCCRISKRSTRICMRILNCRCRRCEPRRSQQIMRRSSVTK
ncbi:hypothetical protein PSAB6_430017 [Paraburkholderia sabiae]|nr:hypothetical protein PSAB6_430017 [Paraburkholderia sabiae]